MTNQLAYTVVTFLSMHAASVLFAQSDNSAVLSGTIRSAGHQRISVVQLSIQSSAGVMLKRQIELDHDGHFEIHLKTANLSHFDCRLSSMGFEESHVTAVVENGSADVGLITLKPRIELGPVSVLHPASRKSVYIEFWITSRVKKAFTITRLSLSVAESGRTACFDSAPMLTLQFTREATLESLPRQQGETSYVVRISDNEPIQSESSIVVQGLLRETSCGSMLFRLMTPYSFSLEPGDFEKARKIRAEVPVAIILPNKRLLRPNWEHASVEIVLDDGDMLGAEAGQ